MSRSSGGIGIIPLLLLGFAFYSLFFDDDKKDTEPKEETEVQITIQRTKEELKKDAKSLIENGKKLLDSVLEEDKETPKEEIAKTKTEGAEEELKKDEKIEDPKKTEPEPIPETTKKPKLKKL